MNYFLQLNKKYFLVFIIISLLSLVSFIIIKQNNLLKKNLTKNDIIKETTYDILSPNFIMNKEKEKIVITADEGNFINKNEILLKNNVVFKSENFKIFSNDVLFNKKKQTAQSKNNSTFFSDKTEINSQGFRITEDGEKIFFNGKTTLKFEQ